MNRFKEIAKKTLGTIGSLFMVCIIILVVAAGMKSCFFRSDIEKPINAKLVQKQNVYHKRFNELFSKLYFSIPVNSTKENPVINFFTGTFTNAFYLKSGYAVHESFTKIDQDIQAGIIAHEISHELLEHIDRISERKELTSFIASSVAFHADPSEKQIISDWAINTTTPSYSRKQEIEADELALRILNFAGYKKPKQILNKTFKYLKESIGDNESGFFSTHPSLESRIDNLKYVDDELYLGKTESIHKITEMGNLHILKQLLSNGIDVNSPLTDKNKTTPLHIAASEGSSSLVRFLIENGANVNASGFGAITPLHMAVMRDDFNIKELELDTFKIVSDLIINGANINTTSDNDFTALQYAAGFNQDIKIIKLLVDNGANINATVSFGVSAGKSVLDAANDSETLIYLIGKGAKSGSELISEKVSKEVDLPIITNE